MNRKTVYAKIDRERERQRKMWPKGDFTEMGNCSDNIPPTVKMTVLLEEVGEVARTVLENDRAQQRTELVQVAAVAVAWLESLPDIGRYDE